MNIRPFSLSLLLMLASSGVVLGAQDAPLQVAAPANAALVYWVAFNQFDSLLRDEEIAKAVSDYPTAEIDAKLRAALQESPALTLLRLASRIEHCDWGTGYMLHEQGPGTLLPHLSHARQLARLGLLSARMHLADKKSAQALEDLMSVYRLSRHSQAGDILICMLVGISIDAMANQFVAEHLASLDEKTLRAFLDEHAKLTPMVHIKQAIIGERDGFGGWLRRAVVKLSDMNAFERLIASLVGDKNAPLLREVAGKSKEEALAMADEMIAMYDPIVKIMNLPPDQFDKAMEDWTKQIAASKNPLVRMMLPAFGASYHTYHRSLAHSAMLRAAITYRLDGKAAFDKIKDPYGDGAFTITENDDGIEIASKLPDRDKSPVKMTVKWKPSGE